MRLKSLLFTPLLLCLVGLIGFGIFAAFSSGDVAWLGVSVAALPLPSLIGLLMARGGVARTSSNLPGVLAVSLVGTIIALFAGPLAFILGAAATSGHLWYVFGYSRLDRSGGKAVKLGSALPAFTLRSLDGREVPSTEFLGKPALFLFFRGNWCPLCMAQIKEVAAQYRRLADDGVEVALISPQPEASSVELAEQYDVPFRFLRDEDLKAARALGIEALGGVPLGVDKIGYGEDTVLPTVIGTDAAGRVIFVDQTDNYRVRPEPETFLKIFDLHAEETATARAMGASA